MASPASPIGELLAAIRAALEPLGIRWYLFGAQAAETLRLRATQLIE